MDIPWMGDQTSPETREQILLEYRVLKDKPCADCGKKYPPYVMDFDHRPGEKKVGNISKMLRGGGCTITVWNGILREIEKCDLVCANCHRERTHGGLRGEKRWLIDANMT